MEWLSGLPKAADVVIIERRFMSMLNNLKGSNLKVNHCQFD